MPQFAAPTKQQSKVPKKPQSQSGSVKARRIYSEREIEDMIMSLPRDLQIRTLGIYQRFGKLEARSALSNLRLAREDLQQLDRELRTMKDEEDERIRQAAADPVNFHTVVSFKRPVEKAESQQLKLEDETSSAPEEFHRLG